MAWNLEVNGVSQPPADWGLSGLQLTTRATAADELTFHAVESVDAAPVITSPFKLYWEDDVWFQSVHLVHPSRRDAANESRRYRALGFWNLLERLTFHQSTKSYDVATDSLVNIFSPHVRLGQAADGTFLTNGQQIAEALNYARTQAAAEGFDFQVDETNLPALEIPVDELRNQSCAEIIRRMLRWSPDAIIWIDYATADDPGGPTFRCARRADLAAVSFDVASGNLIEGLEIAPRTDLQRPAVKITYERAHNHNGQVYHTNVEDIHPAGRTGRELDAVAATINLQGVTTQTLEQEITCDPINALHANEATRLNWWKNQYPELDSADVSNLVIDPANITRSGGFGYPRQLSDGAIAQWMEVGVEQETITAEIFIEDDSGGRWLQKSVQLTATNAVTGVYRHLAVLDSGEPIPQNLAQDIYDAVSQPQFQGSLTLTEKESSNQAQVRHVLNLSGGDSAWETMRALIYDTTVDLDTGITVVSFGPIEHLSVEDLVELLRVSRERRLETSLTVRTTALGGAGSSAVLGKHHPKRVNTGKDKKIENWRIHHDDFATIVIDAKKGYDTAGNELADVMSGRTFRLREVPYCDPETGQDRKIMGLFSEPYD